MQNEDDEVDLETWSHASGTRDIIGPSNMS